jgi:hypothetical protein
VALGQVDLGGAYLSLGRAGEAAPLFERALATCAAAACDPSLVAEADFGLARALVALGGERRRAIELALDAERIYAGLPDRGQERAEVRAWLKRR